MGVALFSNWGALASDNNRRNLFARTDRTTTERVLY